MKKFFKPLILLAAFVFSINASFADFSFNDMELKFAQVSDVHTSNSPDTAYKVLSHSKELLKSTIEDLNKIKGLDFVVFTGDMANEPTKELYKDFFTLLQKLNYPSILVLGNHDSSMSGENPNYMNKEVVYQILRMANPYQNYDNLYFAYSPAKDFRVIVLDTTIGIENSNGMLSEEQLNFLDNEINANQDKVILIFQHHPVVEPFKSEDHKLINAENYLAILKKYEKVPIAIFAGHYHAARIERKGNVIFVATPSLVTYPNAFRTVNITNYNDRVIFTFNFHETKLKDVQELSKSGLIASAVFSGKPSDKNNEIMIRKGYVPKPKLTKEEKAEQKALIKAKKAEEKAKREAEKQADKAYRKAIKEAKKAEKEEKKRLKEEGAN